MTAPVRTAGPAAALALYVFAGFWALAGLALCVGLWHGGTASTTYGDSSNLGGGIEDNAAALTVLILCLLGATLCAVGAAVVDQVARQRATVAG